MPTSTKKSQKPALPKGIYAKIVPMGVDIIDRDESSIAGITERDAIQLHRSLSKLLPKLKAIIKRYDL